MTLAPEPQSAPSDGRSNLAVRIATALVLAPLAILILYAGGWWWTALVVAVACGLFVEWLMVVGAAQQRLAMLAGAAGLIAASLAFASGSRQAALVLLITGLVGATVVAGLRRAWVGAGFVYAAVAAFASLLVRQDGYGFAALMLVLAVVWASDIGGYFAGRTVGGPKLWPRVSPKKTWAGAIGGLAFSLLAAAIVGAVFGLKIAPILAAAAALSVISQLGDLFESAVKRRFGVKDSSQIVPGHGGLLDRLDGYVAAVALAALIGSLRGGLDGVGRGLVIW